MNNHRRAIGHPHLAHPKYRADIDGLRAIAVLSVVAYHAFPYWVGGGFIGVDIFFVISGYLISSIILDNLNQGSFSFSEFYARRIKRIFPALMVVLIACYGFGWFVLLTTEFRHLGKHIAGGAGFVSNILLWNEAGYFDNAANTKPLLHLWSLGIEEQFYIFWPLLLWLVWKNRHGCLYLLVIIAVVSFAVNAGTVNSDRAAAFYSPISRFWELLIGAALSYQTSLSPHFLTKQSNLKSIVGMTLIGIGLLVINHTSAFPGWWALLPTTGTYLLIAAGPHAWFNRNVLSLRVLVWFGLISFPLYLWHWPLLSFYRIVDPGVFSPKIRVALVLASILLAWLTYRFVESNIRFSRQKGVTMALCLIGLLMLTMGGLTWNGLIQPRNNDKQLETIVTAIQDWAYPPQDFEDYKYERQRFYIKRAADKRVLFMGDSHMEQYSPRIDRLLNEKPQESNTAIFATSGGCPPIANVFTEQTRAECGPLVASAIKLALSDDIDTVVIGACWYCYFVKAIGPDTEQMYYYEYGGQKMFFGEGKGVDLSLKSLEEFLHQLVLQKKKVFLILDNPYSPRLDPQNFVEGSRFGQLKYKSGTNLIQREFENEDGWIRARLERIAKNSGATIIDPVRHLCANGICPATTAEGKPIYKDSHHIRPFYAESHCDFIDATVTMALTLPGSAP